MTCFRMFLICVLSLTSLCVTADDQRDYFVYVASESEDEVSLVKFDGSRTEVVQRVQIGFKPTEIEGPHGLTVSPDGKHWFVTVAHGTPFGRVYKYSTANNKLEGECELWMFPASMQISPATGLLYVINFNLHGEEIPSTLSVVDPDEMVEVSRITTGVMPHGSRCSVDGKRHYSVGMMSNDLFEVDAVTLKKRRSLKIVMPGGGHTVWPTWVMPHPDDKRVFVACNGGALVVEVDLKAWRITRRFKTPKGPYNLDLTPDGRLMVVTYKSVGETGVWDIAKGTELARIKNSRKVPHGVVMSPDNKYAFVSVEGIGGEPGGVDVIDLQSYKLVATAEVGKQAGGIAFWKMSSK